MVGSQRLTCAITMLSNQHHDMPHLGGGWIISLQEKCSLTDLDRFVGGGGRIKPFLYKEKVLDF